MDNDRHMYLRLIRRQKAEYEKQLEAMEKRHHAEIFDLQRELSYLRQNLQDAEISLRMKDWEIARKEEQNGALQKFLRREAQFRRSAQTEEDCGENVPGDTGKSNRSVMDNNKRL